MTMLFRIFTGMEVATGEVVTGWTEAISCFVSLEKNALESDHVMKTSIRIAVADDEPDMRRFLYRVLTHEGHHVVAVAENGQQLIDACRSIPPDLVITGVELPEMDGLQAIHEICRTNLVPAIIVSDNVNAELLSRAGQEPVYAFLVKPIKMDDLRPAIWLAMHRFVEMNNLRLQLHTP